MRRMAFIIAFVLIVTLFTVTASEGGTSSQGYTLEEIDKIVMQNNRQSLIDDLDIKAKESAITKAKDTANKLSQAYALESVLSNRITKEVKTAQAEANLEASKMMKQYNLKAARKNAYKAALDIILTNKELEKEKKILVSVEEKYKSAEIKYAKKMITENDLSDAAYAIDNQKTVISGVQARLDSAYLSLKRLMNMTLDYTPIIINGKLESNANPSLDIEKVLADALSKDINTYKKGEALKAADKTMELTEELFKSGDVTYDTNALNLEIAKAEYEQAKIDLEVKVRNAYNDLLNKKDSLDLAQKYLQLMDKKVKAAELRLKNGLISKETLIDEQNKRLDAEYAVYKAIYDCNLAVADFNLLIR